MDTDATQFAVVQDGYGIMGIGETVGEALRDANSFSDATITTDDLCLIHNANVGDYTLLPISDGVVELVEDGVIDQYTMENGILVPLDENDSFY